jgi:hypothetical protein
MTDWHDDENQDARFAFGEMDVRDRIAEALLDANGLHPTTAALDVIMAVIDATDRLDEDWDGNATIPVPPVATYARNAELSLRVLRKNR